MNRPGAKTGRALIGHGNFNYRPIRTRFLAEMHGQRRQKKSAMDVGLSMAPL